MTVKYKNIQANAFGSISCMLIVKRIWTCHMEFALYKLIIISLALTLCKQKAFSLKRTCSALFGKHIKPGPREQLVQRILQPLSPLATAEGVRRTDENRLNRFLRSRY